MGATTAQVARPIDEAVRRQERYRRRVRLVPFVSSLPCLFFAFSVSRSVRVRQRFAQQKAKAIRLVVVLSQLVSDAERDNGVRESRTFSFSQLYHTGATVTIIKRMSTTSRSHCATQTCTTNSPKQYFMRSTECCGFDYFSRLYVVVSAGILLNYGLVTVMEDQDLNLIQTPRVKTFLVGPPGSGNARIEESSIAQDGGRLKVGAIWLWHSPGSLTRLDTFPQPIRKEVCSCVSSFPYPFWPWH